MIDRDIIMPLVNNVKEDNVEMCLYVSRIKQIQAISEATNELLSGNTLVYLSGNNTAYSIEIKSFDKRSISEPDAESVVRGVREGFTENLRTNTSLLRRKIKDKI